MPYSVQEWEAELAKAGSILVEEGTNCVDQEAWAWYSPETHVIWRSNPGTWSEQISAKTRCKLWAVYKVGVPFEMVEEVLGLHCKRRARLPECAEVRHVEEGRNFVKVPSEYRSQCHVCRTWITYDKTQGIVHCSECDSVVWRCSCSRCVDHEV